MVLTVVEPHTNVLDRVPGQAPLPHRLHDALLDRWDEPGRDHAALDLVHELEALFGVRLDTELDIRVLTTTTRLLRQVLEVLDRAANSLPVRNLGLAHIGFHGELSLHAIHDDL